MVTLNLLVCLVSALGQKTTLVEYVILRHDISKWISYSSK